MKRNIVALARSPETVPNRLHTARRPDVRLSALWVGHATVLLQIDDVFILTDPVFTQTVGAGFSRRLVEPGFSASDLPPVDVTVISHMHSDHLSYGTLDLIAPKVRQLLLPEHAFSYIPDYRFPMSEVVQWNRFSSGELSVTAVPVKHPGFRYGADVAWADRSATGWVFELHGITVYFGGDTAYDRDAFAATAARFPHIDLAILPIAPIEPPSFARATHLDGREALQAFLDLRAEHMLAVHYDTFAHGTDPIGYASAFLRRAMERAGIGEDRVHIVPIGGQFTLFPQ
jgi:N-acyl-phosphatidylethanolamine-hydrolysing phospholipase D